MCAARCRIVEPSGPAGVVPVDGALLDRDQHRVGREQLRHRGQVEHPVLFPGLRGDGAVGEDDRRRDVRDGPVECGADGRVQGRAGFHALHRGRWWDLVAMVRVLGRYLGLALPAVARRVLPAGPAAAPRARPPGRSDEQRRDQRLVLLAAAARVVPGLGGGDPRRLRVRRQGQPLHHPPQAAARRPRPAGELPRLGRCSRSAPSSARCCGSCRPGCASTRRGSTSSSRSCRAARARRRSWRASTTRGSTGGRRPRRTPTGRCGTRWRSATRASATRRSSRCCARTTSRWWSPTPPGRSPASRT